MKTAILQTIDEGGLTLWALLALGTAIYAIAYKIWGLLRETEKAIKEEHWIAPQGVSPRELERSFTSFELDRMSTVERRLPFLAVLISAAPLLGLLGTVGGMLLTFSGMAVGAAAPIDTISTGISRALVTTQAGLVIAIPGAFLLALLKRKFDASNLILQRQRHHQLAANY